jgi:CTP synthase (UTP-ammonia lyase)
MSVVRVAIVGDFDRRKHSHWATEAALFHAAARVGVIVEPRWISTPAVAQSGAERTLSDFHAIWGAPGSPYAAMDGILAAIEYARRSDVSYLGTCAGCQYALIEFSRNVLGIRDADTAENAPGGENIVITPVACSVPGVAGSREPRLAGPGVARPVAGSLLERLCGSGELAEEYFCNFEINPTFVPKWREAGLQIAARGASDEVRAVELPSRRFFIAALFQPQLSSSFERPHALIEGFLRAAVGTQSPS